MVLVSVGAEADVFDVRRQPFTANAQTFYVSFNGHASYVVFVEGKELSTLKMDR